MVVEPCFDSFEAEGDEAVKRAKAAAKAAGKETEEYLVSAPELHNVMLRRSMLAARSLEQWLTVTEGDLLVESHGGSLLEVMLANLRDDPNLLAIPFMFARSSLAELIFELRDSEWILMDFHYRGLLATDKSNSALMSTPPREEATIDCGRGCL